VVLGLLMTDRTEICHEVPATCGRAVLEYCLTRRIETGSFL